MADVVLPDVEVTATTPVPARRKAASDNLTLVVRGQEWSGWQRVAIQRSMDQVPSSFSIQLTEKYPLVGDMVFNPGDPCVVKIGGDVVITGYVDRYSATLGPADHTVRIDGRNKSQDLVDCSAFVGDKAEPSFTVKSASAVDIAQQMAKPYGIKVNSTAGQGDRIPDFNIAPGETPWEIIDRVTRYSQLIAYDLPDGSIEFAQVGKKKMASGFTQGVNVEQASVTYAMDQRFQDYLVYIITPLVLASGTTSPPEGKATDDGVPRFRRRIVISEQTHEGQSTAQKRAVWECNRRKGRSQAVQVTCDSWRDSGGALWALNHLAPVKIPAIKCEHDAWCIGAVTYLRDEMGRHAQVTLLPPEAFQPEPAGTLGMGPLLGELGKNNPTKPDNPPYDPTRTGGT